MDDEYKRLRGALILWLHHFEETKKHSENVMQLARSIGGPIQKDTAALMKKFDQLMDAILKLEQETREI